MWGTYQKSDLRIEVQASSDKIRRSLLEPVALREWLKPQQLRLTDAATNPATVQSSLSLGQSFESFLGPLKVHHEVETLTEHGIRFLLSESIDGFHEWQWGDGWVQSRLEGISLLPLSLGQTASIIRLRRYLQA